MAFRRDLSRIDARRVDRTPTGGLRIPATPTRTGVLVYRNADGSERREYRPAEEVFSPASLATLDGAALTIDHPTEPVTPDTWRSLSVGHTSAGERQDTMVACSAYVLDAGAVRRVLDGELVELSCGYDCEYDPTPGVAPDGERYDGVQRSIRYNHVALLPTGWARAGRDARLRLDCSYDTLTMSTATPAPGVTMELAEALRKIGELEASVKALEASRDSEKGRADAAERALATARADASPEAIAAKVRARVALENDVRTVRGAEFKTDGLSDRDLLVAIVGDESKGESDEYLRGAARFVVKTHRDAAESTARSAEVVASRGDVSEEDENPARTEFLKRNADAYEAAKKAWVK